MIKPTLRNSIVQTPRGFTLVELMVTVALLGILLSLSVPSFTQFIGQQQVKGLARDFRSAVLQARSESVKRNSDVFLKANTTWSNGWFVTTDSTDVYADCGGSGACLGVYVSGTDFTAVGAGSGTLITFNKTGRPTVSGISMTFCDKAKSENITQYVVSISMSGSAVINEGLSCDS